MHAEETSNLRSGACSVYVPLRFAEQNLFWSLLVLVALYVGLLSALGITNQPSKERYRRTIRPVVRILGIFVWGGFLAVLYFFLYMIIFDRENFFPQ